MLGVFGANLIVENDVEERAMDVEAAVVLDKAQLSEFVHKVTHPGAGGANHSGQSFLAELRDQGLRFRFLAKVRQQQKDSSQAFLAGVEKLVHQILLNPDIAKQQVGGEGFGK